MADFETCEICGDDELYDDEMYDCPECDSWVCSSCLINNYECRGCEEDK